MDILHAYWRMDYVTAPPDRIQGHRNPFVALHQLGDDKGALIVHRAEHHYLLLNKYPYNPGHLMIVPYREVSELRDLSPAERAEFMDLIVLAQEVLQTVMKPDGFNMGLNTGRAGGAGIPTHLHFHVVPRWNGDSNFITVIGQTRTLPQALEVTWEKLHSTFANITDAHG